jgi:hypothetical protein
MELLTARHLWGVELTWDVFFPKIKELGYQLHEGPLPPPEKEALLKSLLKDNDLGYIAMAFTDGKDVKAHVASFRAQLDRAIALGARQVTAHTGKDFWSMSDCEAFYREIVAIEKDSPIPVGHETHRARAFFNPWTTRDVLERFPTLQLCIDFSHWVCVAERMNWDDENGSIVKLCADRALHIHARVGYEEGPQVPDPTAPEYARHLEQHLKWWDTIFANQRARGMKQSTLTPEFGPPGYMHTLPHTNVPVANLWEICNNMAERMRRRFG